MNCFTILGIEPTTEKKTIKRAYAAMSREFHPEEHPEEFQRIHDAYEEALAWAERNAGRGEEPQMPEEPRRMEEESGEDRMENSREKDEKSEESATQSVEPTEQPKDDSEVWDSDWTRQFQNMADASERQGTDDREVRKIMEQCISSRNTVILRSCRVSTDLRIRIWNSGGSVCRFRWQKERTRGKRWMSDLPMTLTEFWKWM